MKRGECIALLIVFFSAGSIWIHMLVHTSFIFPQIGEPPLPDGVPNIWRAFTLNYIPVDKQFFVISYGKMANLEFKFESRRSIKGLWRGSEGKLIITAPYNATFEGATRTTSWGDLLIYQGSYGFEPWLRVTFPVEKEYYHEWISATVEMDIVYPIETPTAGHFTNWNAHLKRDIRFFVISPEEYEMLEEHRDWESFNESTVGVTIMVVILTSAFFSAGCYVMYTYRTLSKRDIIVILVVVTIVVFLTYILPILMVPLMVVGLISLFIGWYLTSLHKEELKKGHKS